MILLLIKSGEPGLELRGKRDVVPILELRHLPQRKRARPQNNAKEHNDHQPYMEATHRCLIAEDVTADTNVFIRAAETLRHVKWQSFQPIFRWMLLLTIVDTGWCSDGPSKT